MKARTILMIGGAASLAGCVPQPDTPTQPVQPSPLPAAAAPVEPPPASADWRDMPLTPGDWSYRAEQNGGSSARFGAAQGEAIFVIRCEPSRQMRLLIQGAVRGAMTIRTSFGARSLPITVDAQPPGHAYATLSAGDPLLDNIAFSRGRFTVEAPGQRMLVLPSWAEPARVIEDCRR